MIKIWLAVLASTLFIGACGQTATNVNVSKNTVNSTTPARPQPSATVDEVAMAKEIYATNCMICHKESGTGGKVTIDGKSLNPEDLTKEKFKIASDEKLIGYVTDGIPDEGMPAFKGKLTADQIKSVVRHVRALQK